MNVKLFSIFVIIVCASIVSIGQVKPVDPEVERGYLLGPGDEITTKVLGEESFDFVATIDEDGRIGVPFFEKTIDAKCKTERELRADVTTLLKQYLKAPQVSLRVTKRNSRPPVSVYGEVREQQRFDLTRRAYLLDLISYAGGKTERAGGIVQVFRTRTPVCIDPKSEVNWASDASGARSKMYSLAEIQQNIESNPEILPGDIIVVQKAAPVYVIGEVIKPGEFDIPEGGLGLTRAVAMASGTTREAKTKGVKILRQKAGSTEPDVIDVNYAAILKGEQADVILQPFDQVRVGKAAKSFLEYLTDFATGAVNRVPIPIRPF